MFIRWSNDYRNARIVLRKAVFPLTLKVLRLICVSKDARIIGGVSWIASEELCRDTDKARFSDAHF